MKLLRKILTKLAILIGLMLITATGTFVLVELSPIDPAQAYLGPDMMNVSAEQRQKIIEKWGFDQPAGVRYLRWMGNLLRLDLGTSTTFERPVVEVIWSRFQVSIILMPLAWLGSGVFGYLFGILSGLFPDSILDRAIKTAVYLLSSVPAFYAGILVLLVFAVQLKLFPVCCAYPIAYSSMAEASLPELAHHIALPALTLSIVGVPQILMQTREKTIEVMESDYVALAKVNRKPMRQIVFSHVLRNVSLPGIALLFANFVEIFGGSVLVEQVFAYPGLGRATVMAGLNADMALLSGIAVFSVAFVYTGNMIGDLLVGKIDPRISQS